MKTLNSLIWLLLVAVLVGPALLLCAIGAVLLGAGVLLILALSALCPENIQRKRRKR